MENYYRDTGWRFEESDHHLSIWDDEGAMMDYYKNSRLFISRSREGIFDLRESHYIGSIKALIAEAESIVVDSGKK